MGSKSVILVCNPAIILLSIPFSLSFSDKNLIGATPTPAPINKDLWCLRNYEFACKKLESIIDTPLDIDYLNQLIISETGFLKIDEYRNKIEPDLIDGGKYSQISLRGAASKINMQIMKIAANLHLLDEDSSHEIADNHIIAAINIAHELLEANFKLCQDKGIMGLKAEFTAILSLFEKDAKARSERAIIQTKSSGKPFKDFSGNKSDLIRKTLGEMVKQNLLIVSLIDGKVNYSAT